MNLLKMALPLFAALLVLRGQSLSAQSDNPPSDDRQAIAWMSWEEAMQRRQDEPRKIVLDIFADWCEMCKHMENTTFQHPELARFINRNFYPVRLDVQQRNQLSYQGKTYGFVQDGKVGYHGLAAELLRGQMSFPALVFLDEEMELIQSFVGFKTAAQFEKIAAYFASDLYKQTPWSTFQRNFTPCITE